MNLKQKYFNFLKKSREENLKDDIKNLMALREVKTITFLIENFLF